MDNIEFLDRRFIGCTADFKDAQAVLFGAPFDGTVTYRPGSRFGPPRMRTESFGIETYSPYLDRDLEEIKVHDAGDLDLPFGNKESALEMISKAAAFLLENDKIPVMLGGEHLVTLPAVLEVYKKYPDLCVLHFDAHADLREEYIGEPLSHSTVMRRIWDKLGDGRIWQFGIRSGTREEYQFMRNAHVKTEAFTAETIDEAISEIGKRPVYITIDVDVLDSSVFPGTGTPEAGGITFKELITAVVKLKGMNIAGADIVELAPDYDQSGGSTAAACKLLRELLLTIC